MREKINHVKKYFKQVASIAQLINKNEVTNYKLLHKLSSFKKALILSTGMSDSFEIDKALNILEQVNETKISILHCSSLYPCKYEDVNLNVIDSFIKKYDFPIGYSDHTLDNLSSCLAVSKGACIFEKHITLSKKDTGPDHFYSLEPDEFKKYVNDIQLSFKIMGSNKKNFLKKEKLANRKLGIYSKKNIKTNELIKKDSIVILSPQKGLNSIFANTIINSYSIRNIKKGDPINWKDIYFI